MAYRILPAIILLLAVLVWYYRRTPPSLSPAEPVVADNMPEVASAGTLPVVAAADAVQPLATQVSETIDPQPPPDDSAPVEADPPKMPFVFRTNALATLKLNDDQRAAVYELQTQFIDEIGGLNQDTSDPTYLERWKAAQPEFDEKLAVVVGRFFMFQMDAVPEVSASGGP
jgi:hypothetical protein